MTTKKRKKKAAAAPATPPPIAPVGPLWQANNKACQVLFSVLKLLVQMEKTSFFKPTGTLPLKALAYFLVDGSGVAKSGRAHAIALQLDSMFLHFGATYEDSAPQPAITAMHAVLEDGEQTVAHLAAVCDRHYLFFRENEA
jgi:hypothetical protein